MGKPAARMGDMTVHGGSIVVGFPTVLIGGQPAARLGDMHVCPMVNPGLPPPPHVGGPISLGSSGVLIGGVPAARVGDMATCAGPPDTIAPPGCPTVLIGEAAGGGGGGGGAGSPGSGGGSGGAGASDLGMEVATFGAEPPEREEDDTHWAEYEIVDSAGNPVAGESFEFTNSDDTESGGVLPSSGRISRRNIPEGNTQVKLRSVSNAQWSKEEARPEEKIQLTADTEGFEDGTPVKITIYERDLHNPDDLVQRIDVEVSGNKVEGEWEYRYEEEEEEEISSADGPMTPSHPEYYFIVEVKGSRVVSGLLHFRDWIEIELKDAEGNPIPDKDYTLHLSSGEIRQGKLDGDGKAREEKVPPGDHRLSLD